jgi:hypothetical protein
MNPGGEPDISPLVFRLLLASKKSQHAPLDASTATMGAPISTNQGSRAIDRKSSMQKSTGETSGVSGQIEQPIVDLFQTLTEL